MSPSHIFDRKYHSAQGVVLLLDSAMHFSILVPFAMESAIVMYPKDLHPIVPFSKFLKVTIGLDLFRDIENKFEVKKRWVTKSWRLLSFLVNLQCGIYVLSQLAVPTLISSFLTSVKGIRSQMSNLAAFLAHSNLSITGFISHFLLILIMPRTIQQLLTSLAPIHLQLNSVKLAKLRRFSIAVIIYIILGVLYIHA